ncbi:hypothetical protein NQ317_008690, partial [Molorchus minor]
MSGQNILNAISIRAASQEEIDTLQRLSLVCDHAVSHFLKDAFCFVRGATTATQKGIHLGITFSRCRMSFQNPKS